MNHGIETGPFTPIRLLFYYFATWDIQRLVSYLRYLTMGKISNMYVRITVICSQTCFIAGLLTCFLSVIFVLFIDMNYANRSILL